VPVADATPGINKFAVDTASTLQCTFGPGLPNNRLIIKKTPEAIIVSDMSVQSRKVTHIGAPQLEEIQVAATHHCTRLLCINVTHPCSAACCVRCAAAGPARHRQCHHNEPEDAVLWWRGVPGGPGGTLLLLLHAAAAIALPAASLVPVRVSTAQVLKQL
jgi:hypothetical protein